MDFLHSIDWQTLLNNYGYWAILLGTFLEGETIVILAGILAATGHMSFAGVAGCALLGSVSSDQLMFFLGQWKGNAILSRFPRLARPRDKVARLLTKYDIYFILGFRFVYGVRNVTPILLGISEIPFRRFLLYNVVGAIIWSISFTAGGFFFGHAVLHLLELFDRSLLLFLFCLGGLLLIGGSAFWIWKKRKPTRSGT